MIREEESPFQLFRRLWDGMELRKTPRGPWILELPGAAVFAESKGQAEAVRDREVALVWLQEMDRRRAERYRLGDDTPNSGDDE